MSGTARGFGSPARTQILTLCAICRTKRTSVDQRKSMRTFVVSILVFITCIQCSDHQRTNYKFVFTPKTSVVEIEFLEAKPDSFNVKAWTALEFPYRKIDAEIKITEKAFLVLYSIQRPRYSYIKLNNDQIRIFTIPEDTLKITFNPDNQSHSYKGKGSDINKYLRDKEATFRITDFISSKGRLSSTATNLDKLKQTIDSISKLELVFLDKVKSKYNLPKWFIDFETNDIVYFGASVKINAPSYRRSLLNLNENIPLNYFDFLDKVKKENNLSFFSEYFIQYMGQLAENNLMTDSLEKMNVHDRLEILYPKELEYFDNNFDQPVRDFAYANLLSFEIVGNYLGDSTFVSESINRISDKSIISYLISLRNDYSIKTLRKGDLAPNFFLIDQNDSITSLKTLGGNIILISFWATWCKPCIKEFPFENRLHEEFKNSKFKVVSVCMGSNEKAWRNRVEKLNLQVLNLYANENWRKKIESDYGINSLPFYTLVDKQGRIIAHNTSNPSDKKLKKLIIKAVK